MGGTLAAPAGTAQRSRAGVVRPRLPARTAVRRRSDDPGGLGAVRTFLDLAPEKLLEEKIDAERIRNPNFWKEFYDQAQVQIRRIPGLLTDLVAIATERNDSPSLEELRLDKPLPPVLETKRQFVAEWHHDRRSNSRRASALIGGAGKIPTPLRLAAEG